MHIIVIVTLFVFKLHIVLCCTFQQLTIHCSRMTDILRINIYKGYHSYATNILHYLFLFPILTHVIFVSKNVYNRNK